MPQAVAPFDEAALEDFLSGSPWDDCEIIAREDLADWFMEFSNVDASCRTAVLVKELMAIGAGPDQSSPSEGIGPVSSSVAEVGDVSTASSLHSSLPVSPAALTGVRPALPSNIALPSASMAAGMSSKADSHLEKKGRNFDEWELEFMLRGVLELHGPHEPDSPVPAQQLIKPWTSPLRMLNTSEALLLHQRPYTTSQLGEAGEESGFEGLEEVDDGFCLERWRMEASGQTLRGRSPSGEIVSV